MGRLAEGWRRLRALVGRTALERRLDEEIDFHLERQIEKHRREGLDGAEARRAARVSFGGIDDTRERAREESRPARFEDLLRDLRYGLRAWRHAPGLTVVCVLTLALGMGATTAVFAVSYGVLLKSLPYPEADRLVDLRHFAPGIDIPGGTPSLSATQWLTYRDTTRVFEHVGLWQLRSAAVLSPEGPDQVPALFVTQGTLDALAVKPALGRVLSRTDDEPGSPETVLITHGFWQRRFGSDSGVPGRTLVLDGVPRTIIGVLPRDFRFLDRECDLVLPFRFDASALRLGQFNYRGLAKLRSGVTLDEANADLARVIPIWLQAWPPPPGIDRALFEAARFTPALRPLEQFVVGDAGELLWVLLGAVGLVLLIACANVANLLLVRSEARRREMAMRSALGAGRLRLVRALLVEHLALGIAGGALGLALALAALHLLVRALAGRLPRADAVAIDPVVVAFAVGISLTVSLVFGLMTAGRRSGADLAETLRSGSPASAGGLGRTRRMLVILQVSLATALLVASGLMVRSFVAASRVDPGFTDPATLQLLRITIPSADVAEPLEVFRMQHDVRGRLAAIPGVTSVAFASTGPMQAATSGDPMFVEHQTYADGQIPPIRSFKFVSPGYFATIGGRLVAGRDFTWDDLESSRPVAIVIESLAREVWGSAAEALRARIRDLPGTPWREVVGVVADVRDEGLSQPAPSTVYWPALPVQVIRSMTFVMRTPRAGMAGLLADVRAAVRGVSGSLPVAGVRTAGELYDDSLRQTSIALALLAIAAAMALGLSLVGIYGVLSHAVAVRTREIGIRAALGAGRGTIRGAFVREGVMLSALGTLCGLGAAALLTEGMRSMLVGVSARDPVTYVAAAAALMVTAVVASYVPASRATAISPIVALRAP